MSDEQTRGRRGTRVNCLFERMEIGEGHDVCFRVTDKIKVLTNLSFD